MSAKICFCSFELEEPLRVWLVTVRQKSVQEEEEAEDEEEVVTSYQAKRLRVGRDDDSGERLRW